MTFQQLNKDLIGLISSFLPYDEIIINLRNVNKQWKDSISNSYDCWLNIDLTETMTEFQCSKEDISLEEIKMYSNIISSIRLSNPINNISGFLSKMILINDKSNNYERCKMWNKLENIEIYNKSLIIPIKNNKNYHLLPFKSLFRLGINENILQLLKCYEISNKKSMDESENNCDIKYFMNSFTDIINYYPFKSVKRIIIDYPISTKELNILSNCFPCLKDIVITRLFHETNTYNGHYEEFTRENRRLSFGSEIGSGDDISSRYGNLPIDDENEFHFENEIVACWEAIYNFLQVIPPNQLRILQFNVIPSPNPKSGKWTTDNTISRIVSENTKNGCNYINNNNNYKNNNICNNQNILYSVNDDKNEKQILESVEIYKAIKRSNREYIDYKNKIMRTNEYYNNNSNNDNSSIFNHSSSMINFDEVGDKLMKYILDMHSESLVALSCPDLEVSFALYKRLLNQCPKLKLWDLPGWRIFSCIN
ncbi:unnamed protein product [Cryptosporidium hominis]|uniref:F-box domain-containing protein n=1 Tax=Cryptosporidium hominis TaxID=237895 RepID=A0A0S4TH38_CRYHO|nr:hypothetical protein ChTU502y2012_385g0430 [Cryptosporidium hominis]PPA65000.1 hypothetical protein ChUKH1_02795 [Cryptosporidium hominis]PPS94141.1 Uncharacterized protein GY17_00002911 [Cryptosporidium hominis]CUV06021.1 unnamed protein product [Cryptosporidium hominis]|eukprot:PPS94141.1 Uncharacterized protein GY17_00002911 [Cryptosporidium hominis]